MIEGFDVPLHKPTLKKKARSAEFKKKFLEVGSINDVPMATKKSFGLLSREESTILSHSASEINSQPLDGPRRSASLDVVDMRRESVIINVIENPMNVRYEKDEN